VGAGAAAHGRRAGWSQEGGGGELPRTEEESRMEGLVCYGKHSGQVY